MINQLTQNESSEIIAHLFPTEVSGLILPVNDYVSQLNSDEYEIIRQASDKRKFEFSTGRWCAKQLLALHEHYDFSILSGEHREPIWPDKFSGSISHCKDQCGAVIANINQIKSIGFDVETIRNLKNNIAKIICTDAEKLWINKQSSHTYDRLVQLLFSLKESVYKCAYQYQQLKLGFQDCSIHPDFDSNIAQITFNIDNIHANIKLRFKLTGSHIYSGAFIL